MNEAYGSLVDLSGSGVPSSDHHCAMARRITPPRPSSTGTQGSRRCRRACRPSNRIVADPAAGRLPPAARRDERPRFQSARAQAVGARSAFYTSIWTAQSDTPAHEGPTHHAAIELWTYPFPLTPAAEAKLTQELQSIPPLLAQARVNLIGNARDLWIAGIGTIKEQRADLDELAHRATPSERPCAQAGDQGAQATTRTSSRGSSSRRRRRRALGHRQGELHLEPAQRASRAAHLGRRSDAAQARAGARAHVAQARGATQSRTAGVAGSPAPRNTSAAAKDAVTKYMDFMRARSILPVRDYMDPAMRERIGEVRARRDAGTSSPSRAITSRSRSTRTSITGGIWRGCARSRMPARSAATPLLYNIWDSRAEGMATAMEEMMLHAGLYDDSMTAKWR